MRLMGGPARPRYGPHRVAPPTGGGYELRASFGDNLRRLREIKAVYDKENLFRLNSNIPPATRLPWTAGRVDPRPKPGRLAHGRGSGIG
jgi:hypothetical protein